MYQLHVGVVCLSPWKCRNGKHIFAVAGLMDQSFSLVPI